MSALPRVSVIIPWFNRPEIARTVRENFPIVQHADGELIIVNCGGDQNQLQTLLQETGMTGMRVASLSVPSFNKSLALNFGAELARAEYFFSLDSDVLLDDNALETTMAAISGKLGFATVTWVRQSAPEEDNRFRTTMLQFRNAYLCSMINTIGTEVIFSDGTSAALSVKREEVFTGSLFGCGLLMVKKEHLVRVGAYNSELQFWGWEDLDVQLRLKKYLGLEHFEAGEACHLSHGDEHRSLGGRPKWATNLENLGRAFSRYSKGDFLGSLEADLDQWRSSLHQWEV